VKTISHIFSKLKFDTYGWIAVSSLLVCTVSGIPLAVPYDVTSPFESLSLILLDNPAASFIRNLHFWSAQIFLIFTLIHVFDHFPKYTEYNLSKGVWFRLILSLVAVFFVMLTGFLLRGDPDAVQARQILSVLLLELPLAGRIIEYSLLGSPGSLQLIYIHHVATTTILIFIIFYEHAGSLWPKFYNFLLVFFLLVIISFFFRAPLHDGYNPVIKGPWYFVGLQEILHWLKNPSLVWWLILFLLLIMLLIRFSYGKVNKVFKRTLLLSVLVYILLTIIGYFFRGENWNWEIPFTTDNGNTYFPVASINKFQTLDNIGSGEPAFDTIPQKIEGCLACHDEMIGFSPAHDPKVIGCISCHSGDPYILDKDMAHRGLVKVPGNIDDARRSCGTASCHPVITERVNRSIMATLSGMVSVDRFIFGETDSLTILSHIRDIGHSAADQHLRDMCAHCHLGNVKDKPGAINELSRGGGCNACHLNYDKNARNDLVKYLSDQESYELKFHPSLSINITRDHCFGCHSRSGRISLSYEGWHETLLEIDEIPDSTGFTVLEDQRILKYIESDIHQKGGMECIDCHTSFGLMGDGTLYSHKEDQVKIACDDCHYMNEPEVVEYDYLDYESSKIARLREYKKSSEFLKSRKSGFAIVNTKVIDGKPYLRLNSSDTLLPIGAPAEVCTKTKAHVSLDCQACHSSWVPQCIGCHNSWDENAPGYDLLDHREKQGSWVEFVGQYHTDPPVLGILENSNQENRVGTFTPGMILSIDKSGFPGSKNDQTLFHRLYAPISTHTITSNSRSCISCHLDPLALGYGRGRLEFDTSTNPGTFRFKPRFAANPNDGLPEDAWTGFLQDRKEINSTRDHTRPFNVNEQQKILTVGACLTCHNEDSRIMEQSLNDFEYLLENMSSFCVVPDWINRQ